jgi:hypothetical protein
MSYEERDDYGMYRNKHGKGPGPEQMGARTLIGDHVHNLQNEHLGDKLFAVPWQALTLDTQHRRFTMDIPKERIENAPGFDSDHWPDMADQSWVDEVHTYFGTQPSDGAPPAEIREWLDAPSIGCEV